MKAILIILCMLACVPKEPECKQDSAPSAVPTATVQPSTKPTRTPIPTSSPNPLTVILFVPETPQVDQLFTVKICGYQSFELISLWDKEKRIGKMAFDKIERCHKMALVYEKELHYLFLVKRGDDILAKRELR